MLIYCLRVYLINGWYIITYGLGIYVLNLLIGFLSPQSDPETEGPVRSRTPECRARRKQHSWRPLVQSVGVRPARVCSVAHCT